ncbi:MAG: type II/IV secretion system ATPase subunit [Candidatus Bathyarchaeota archaeon]|nr:type II/IV secretion system ATPase subunit [Candidatus Bathyarchaeota archaeon]MDH5733516.1 type II/IV secretion system ATPase subunit [Candidatus Bathyarchaeota archaeon]
MKTKLTGTFKKHPKKMKVEKLGLLRKEICKTLEEAMQKHPHFASYLEALPAKPTYAEHLDFEKFGGKANLIYPVGFGIYAHIRAGTGIGEYNLVEPEKPSRLLLDQVESAVARLVSDEKYEKDTEAVLTYLYKEAVRKKLVKIPSEQRDMVLYYFLRQKIKHGFLEGFLADPWLEDISVPGEGNVFVYHKMFASLESNVEVLKDEVDLLLRSISERYGKVLSYTHPILDVHLPDGSRFNIVFGEDISLKGSNFTIRKFPEDPISVAHLIRWKTFSAELAGYLWMLLDVGITCFFCGETASGKTTSLNALTGFIKSDSKIVSIEETPEVNIYHRNWVREVTRLHTGSKVDMFDLLKAALRQRPDYIIVGEIRGEEGRVAFQGVQTGHPVLSTMHAGGLGQLFQRLTSHPINVPKSQISALNLAIFQGRIRRGQKLIRRVLSVNEIISYDMERGNLNFIPTFVYDTDTDRLRVLGSSYMLETKVLEFRAWGKEKIPELYKEMQVRAEIFSYLSQNYPRFVDVWKTVVKVQNEGVWGVYERVKEGKIPWE